MRGRHAIVLDDGGLVLRAYEPTADEVAAVADRLAAYYNEPHNRAMLAHTQELTAADVAEHYQGLAVQGGRAFLLEHDGDLVGDADLRRLERDRAELAILVGDRSRQGRGLGTRFGVMLHAFAFGTLGVERVYASIIPANVASLRLFERLGHQRDDGAVARGYADQDDDVTLSLTRARFDELHGALAARVHVTGR